jgi:hypothetical protein
MIELVTPVQAAEALGCTWRKVGGVLGEPFAILREGINEFPAWRIERLTAVRLGEKVERHGHDAVEMFSLSEMARLAGIGVIAMGRRLPSPVAFRSYGNKSRLYWPRQYAIDLRRAMKLGIVPLPRTGWKRVADNVSFAPARHTLAAEQAAEDACVIRHQPKAWSIY